jgi:hypothetical protein
MTEISRRSLVVGAGATAVSLAGAVVLREPGTSAPNRGRATRTSFGSVALLAWSRAELMPAGPHAAGHGHVARGVGAPVPSAVHGAWTAAVTVDVQVHNGADAPMELSAGQFRMRVDRDGTTVSLYRADRRPGSVAAGSTTALRISYLAPPPERALSLEFADAGDMRTIDLGRLGRNGSRA